MPQILDPLSPAQGDSAGQGDDQIRELKQFIADLFGLPVAPAQILNPIGSTTTNGVFNFTSNPGGQRSLPGIVGFTAFNNGAQPHVQFDMGANYVSVKQLSGDESVIGLGSNLGLTTNLQIVGPAPNGRDQGPAFPSPNFVHFYWIYNPSTSTIASIASLNGSVPTLPTGYTHFVYATTVLIDGSGNLIRVHQRGSWLWFDTPTPLITGGTNTTETFVNYGGVMPDQALNLTLETRLISNGTTVTGFDELHVSLAGGIPASNGPLILSSSAVQSAGAHMRIMIPNVGVGGLYYQIIKTSTSTVTAAISLMGYQVPNGDS